MGRVWQWWVGVTLSVCASAPIGAQITFQVNRITDINVDTEGVQVIAAGNFRNNARQDIVAVDNFGSRFFIYLNDGTGNFSTAPAEFGTGDGPVAITVGDFNLDGNLDVATANEDADSVTTYLGDGTGSFNSPHDYDIPDGSPQVLAAVDMDNDRDADLAVLTDETVYLLRSNGDGTFTPFTPASLRTRGSGGIAIVAALLNEDFNLDLAVSLADSNQISVLYGGGDGTFQTPQLHNVGPRPNGLVAASLKTAGRIDLAVVDTNEDADLNVSLLFNNGEGGFDSEVRTTAEVSSIAIATGDFDGQGAIDLAVTNVFGGQSVAFLRNDPDAPMSENGFLLLSRGVGLGNGASAIQTANLNGDGKPDLIVLGLTDGAPSVIGALINTSGETPTPSTPTPSTPGPTPTPTPTFSFSGVGIEIGSATGRPGDTVDLGVSMQSTGVSVGALTIDIFFGNSWITATPSSCRLNPAYKNTLVAGELPGFPSAGISSGLRVSILATETRQTIPNGVLFTCSVNISPAAAAIPYGLALGSIGAYDTEEMPIFNLFGTSGTLDVSLFAPSPSPTATKKPMAGDDGCTITSSAADSPSFVWLTIALLIARTLSISASQRRRRRGW